METLNKPSSAEVREKQRESWNKFSGGWKKWDELTMNSLRPVGRGILDSIPWKDNFIVLDIASGTPNTGASITTGSSVRLDQ